MSTLKPVKNLKNSPLLPADREHQLLAYLLACYSESTQKILAHPDQFDDSLIQWAQTLGLGVAPQQDGYDLIGLDFSFKTKLQSFKSFANTGMDLHTLFFLSYYHREITVEDLSQEYAHFLLGFLHSFGFKGEYTEDCLKIEAPNSSVSALKKVFKAAEFNQRNFALWRTLQNMESCSFEEPYSVRTQLLNLAATWGFSAQIDSPQNMQNLSELERRLLKLRGGMKKQNSVCTFETPLKMRKRALPLYGDSNYACALTTLACLAPGSNLILKDVLVSSSKTHFYQHAKKMGAQLDINPKKESLGEQYGTVKIKYSQDLSCKKISGEGFLQSLDEIPLLAVLACFAEGESVIRGFDLLPERGKILSHALLENLKRTGVDIGEFEEGLVIRGRPELDGAQFDALGIPSLSLAFEVLGRVTKGGAEVIHSCPVIQAEFGRLVEECYA